MQLFLNFATNSKQIFQLKSAPLSFVILFRDAQFPNCAKNDSSRSRYLLINSSSCRCNPRISREISPFFLFLSFLSKLAWHAREFFVLIIWRENLTRVRPVIKIRKIRRGRFRYKVNGFDARVPDAIATAVNTGLSGFATETWRNSCYPVVASLLPRSACFFRMLLLHHPGHLRRNESPMAISRQARETDTRDFYIVYVVYSWRLFFHFRCSNIVIRILYVFLFPRIMYSFFWNWNCFINEFINEVCFSLDIA